MKSLKLLLMSLFFLIVPGTSLSQNGKRKPDCHDSVIVYSKLYEKTIRIAQACGEQIKLRDAVILNQDTIIHKQSASIEALTQDNSNLKQKVKARNIQLGTATIVAILLIIFL